MSTPDLTIIIVNWNTRTLLTRALECVHQTVQRTSYEIIVVDNASADDSVDMVRSRFPEIKLIVNRQNLGFAAANNQAARLAQGRYFLLLNPDAFVHEGAIDRLVDFMETHADAGAAGCRLFYQDGTLQRSCTAFPTLSTELWAALWLDKLLPRHPIFGRYQMMYWEMDDIREVDSLMGACLIVRKEAIPETGLFDERFFMYSEEVDLCFRLKQAGWKNFFVPTAQATHVWVGTVLDENTGKVKIKVEPFLRMYKSRVLFFRKHYGRFIALLYKLVLLLASVLRVMVGPILFLTKRDQDVLSKWQNYWLLFRLVWAF